MLALAFENLGYMALVVLGVGFLIFVHELGHFLAARAAGVRVEVFSIGFGTRLFGWKDRKGTDWRICLVPIGGYVKMYGETPGEGAPEDPDALGSKSVGWRFLIFSGGVIMNVIFAAIAFPIAFGVGIPFDAPVAGSVAPGSPAAKAGIREGDRFVSLDGSELHSFDTLQTEAALSGDEGLLLEIERAGPDGPERLQVRVHPRYEPRYGLKLIGVDRPTQDELRVSLEQHPGSPAGAAGVTQGAELLALNGKPMSPEAWLDATRELRGPTAEEYVEKPVEVRIRTQGGAEKTIRYQPTLDPGSPVLGVVAPRNTIARLADPEKLAGLALERGDVVVALVAGEERIFVEDEKALVAELRTRSGQSVALAVRRATEANEALGTRKLLELPIPGALLGAGAEALLEHVAWSTATSVSNFVVVQPGSAAAEAGLGTGARVTSIDGKSVQNFADLATIVRAAKGAPLQVEWLPFSGSGPAAKQKAEITPRSIPFVDFGFTAYAEPLREIYRVSGIGSSMLAGAEHCVDTLRRLYATLKRIFGGSVDANNLGGIITIGVATYEKARSGFMELLFFLAILSLNLAFINVLPIPVLDGGHLMFLFVEAIKGSPVSVRVMTYAQFVGLMLVLALMVYVIFNDLVRHVF